MTHSLYFHSPSTRENTDATREEITRPISKYSGKYKVRNMG